MPEERVGQPRTRPSAADRVALILAAAEAAAEQVRRETEDRMQARIAEGERAAQYRISAAEQEAVELVAEARREAERLLRESHERDEAAKTTATSEALAIVSEARESADQMVAQATEAAARSRAQADRHSRELLSDARATAEAVRQEGTELVGNLRQMGDSLRANAERLLRDVQSLHTQMISRIEVVEASRDSALTRMRAPRDRSVPSGGDTATDVPEFIPRR